MSTVRVFLQVTVSIWNHLTLEKLFMRNSEKAYNCLLKCCSCVLHRN